MKTVLFLRTGNYYRSRFAEESFNHQAIRTRVRWMAQSRGLAIERGIYNFGSLSPFAVQALKDRGLLAQGGARLPQQYALVDLQTADHIIALDEDEHRPLMLERFPLWEGRTEYWRIGVLAPNIALSEIDKQIGLLLGRLLA